MTSFHFETVNCPYCLNEEEIAIWDIVHYEEDPDLKDKILLKDLQIYECQNCNHRYTLEKPFLYIDPEKKILIYYSPENAELFNNLDTRDPKTGGLKADLSEILPKDFAVDLDTYRLRIVTDYNDLIEKIHIFDYQLDDRLIEIIKLATKLNPPIDYSEVQKNSNSSVLETDTDTFVSESTSGKADKIISLHFLGIEAEQYLFQSLNEENVWKQMAIKPDVYKNALNLLSNDLPELSTWNIIDEIAAKIFLNNFQTL